MEIKRKDIPNEDFECNPKGECWCMDEEFPQLPSASKDICYSPNEIQEITLSQNEMKRFQLPKSTPNPKQ